MSTPIVEEVQGIYYTFLCIDNYSYYPRLYVHKLRTKYVLTRSHDQGLSVWIKINDKDVFETIDDINTSLQSV